MLTDHDKDMMMIGRPLTVYPEKPTSSCMVDSIVGNDFRPLEIGEKIQDGDVFVVDSAVHPATDTGTGVMDDNHYPHYRSIANTQADRPAKAGERGES